MITAEEVNTVVRVVVRSVARYGPTGRPFVVDSLLPALLKDAVLDRD